MRDGVKIRLLVGIYGLGSLFDNSTTYIYAVKLGLYREANPLRIPVVYGYPLWMWFLVDFAFLALVLVASLLYRCMVLRFACKEVDADKRRRHLWLASKWWMAPAIMASLRLLPATHNLLLICFGFETPLPKLLCFAF